MAALKKIFALVLWAFVLPATAAEMPTFMVVAEAGKLSPARLEVPARQRLKLILKNAGALPVEFENLDLRVEKVLAPGAASFVIVPALAPGEYKFVDEFHPDTGVMILIAR